VKAFQSPQGNKKVHFTRAQEVVRKDVENAFVVLHSSFAMVWGPAKWWRKEDLGYIMQVCVLLHNMINEDEEDDFNYQQEGARELTPKEYQNHDPLLKRLRIDLHMSSFVMTLSSTCGPFILLHSSRYIGAILGCLYQGMHFRASHSIHRST
jgi:hypothetical protein